MRRAVAAACGALALAASPGPAAAAPPAAGGTSSPAAAASSAVPTDASGLSPSGGPLVWIALGASALALLVSAGALAFAVAASRRARDAAETSDRRPYPSVDPRLLERVDRLEARLRAPAAALHPEAPSFPPPPAPAAFPPGAPPAPPAGTSSDAAGGVSAWSEALAEDFARFARDPAFAAPDFLARHRPRGAVLGPEGATLLDGFEEAKLWAVRAPGEAEAWALTPGEQAVLNWSAHFAPRRTEVAEEVFGPAFDLVADGGGAPRLQAPALLRRDAAGRLVVRRRGRLAGFRT